MCGICGIIDFHKEIEARSYLTENMAEKIAHRGPDDKGHFNDENISLGFRRLSILDVKNGNQPVFSSDKNIISIFNGEIYNFKEIKNELIKKGYSFKSNSDSEIIPFAYELWGINFIKKLNGMFSIAIYDKLKKEFFLIRDRLGIKPLYYFNYKKSIIFSSEINSLISIPFFNKKINFKAISSYLSYRYPTEDNNNFFQGIKRLPAGSYLIFSRESSPENKMYWQIPFPNSTKEEKESYYLEKLDFLLNQSVERQLISDVPLGVFLSGGLDSSLLSAIASKFSGNNLNTYSVRLSESGYDESHKAKLVSNFLNTNHHEVILKETNFLDNLNNLIKIKGTPASIPHEYALYLLSKEMKKKISVVLSGEGADEFFGGYSRVQKSPFDFYKNNFFKLFKNISNERNFLNFINKRYNWFSPNDKNKLLSDKFLNETDLDVDLTNSWKEIFKSGSLKSRYNQVLYMFQTKHLKCLLDRLDCMTMAAGIEARVPFLDHELVEFINSVPFSLKIKWKSKFHIFKSLFSSSEKFSEKNDINKYLLRKVSKNYLPPEISRAKKLGFPIPLNQWIKKYDVENILLNKHSLSKEFYNGKALREILQMNSDTNYDFAGKKVWMLLNIELWMRQHFG